MPEKNETPLQRGDEVKVKGWAGVHLLRTPTSDGGGWWVIKDPARVKGSGASYGKVRPVRTEHIKLKERRK